MICTICGIDIDAFEEAYEEDWTAVFYEGEQEHGPLCGGCSDQFLEEAEDGELELKEEYHGKIIYQQQELEEDVDWITLDLGFILN